MDTVETKITYRWFTQPDYDRDQYSVFVLRYDRDRHHSDPLFPVRATRCYYLTPEGAWVLYPPGSVLTPFCQFPGDHLNPYVATEDWRDAVASVVDHHVLPVVTTLIKHLEAATT